MHPSRYQEADPDGAARQVRATAARKTRQQLGTPVEYPVTSSERQYSPDELEFLQAVERYRVDYHRRYPTLAELLHILHGLGYSKAS